MGLHPIRVSDDQQHSRDQVNTGNTNSHYAWSDVIRSGETKGSTHLAQDGARPHSTYLRNTTGSRQFYLIVDENLVLDAWSPTLDPGDVRRNDQ